MRARHRCWRRDRASMRRHSGGPPSPHGAARGRRGAPAPGEAARRGGPQEGSAVFPGTHGRGQVSDAFLECEETHRGRSVLVCRQEPALCRTGLDEAGPLQDVEVFGHGLSGDAEFIREIRREGWIPQPVEDSDTHGSRKRAEGPHECVVLGAADSLVGGHDCYQAWSDKAFRMGKVARIGSHSVVNPMVDSRRILQGVPLPRS